MRAVYRQLVELSAVMAAVAMATTAAFGCGSRTGLEGEAPLGSPGGSKGSGGHVVGPGGSGGYGDGAGGVGGSSDTTVASTYKVTEGGYVESGPWGGYAWTVVDSSDTTISPSEFSGVGAGGRLCVKGVVSDHGYEVYAILGINIAQARDESWAGVWTPAGSGLAYRLTTNLASPLRIQIQGAAGYPSESWCMNLTGNSGKIAWTQFKQYCWADYGSPYDGKTPLQSVMFEVPGGNSSRVSYDFCVSSVEPY
jgi:hypothetical protein